MQWRRRPRRRRGVGGHGQPRRRGAVATLEPVRIGADGHSDPFATEARVTAEGRAGPVGDTEDPELAVYPDPTSGIKIRHGSDMGRGARVGRRSTATSNGT